MYRSVPGKRPLLGKRPYTEFQGVTVAASIQTYGIYIPGKRPCGPKSQVILKRPWVLTWDTTIHVHIALYNVMSLHVMYKCLHCTYMYKLTIIISIVPVCSPGYLSSGESPFCHHSPSTRPSWNIMPI